MQDARHERSVKVKDGFPPAALIELKASTNSLARLNRLRSSLLSGLQIIPGKSVRGRDRQVGDEEAEQE
ncbi:hypothetical protein Pmani_028587 [Petrolisthes manimaculis]|uniref:Uncharacterized protein n=1 Tax=Petrolisthes manimaculis TaxID=1843537 RepID=A0AAE1NZT7_9EUCA|nr:hypothetical protein Pmani_028587 [Petrolisthes manimaculis]